nr:hypothetical protein [Tanacetum cinerariifolium]
MLKDSVINGPYKFKSLITAKDTYGVTDIRHEERLEDLKGDDKLRYDSDIKAVNILLLGFPVDIYTLINQFETTKEIWDHVGTYGRFVTTTKQARGLYSVTFDQLYALLKHNENDAKEVREMRQRFPEPLALLLQDTTNFKADYVDTYDSDCDDEDTTNAIFMANLSLVGSLNCITIAPVMILTHSLRDDADNYVSPPVKKDDMMLSVIKQIKSQVEKCTKVNQESKSEIESLTSELERYKYRVRVLGYAVKDGHSEQEAYLTVNYTLSLMIIIEK